ncbi:uncharacterized protein CHAB577_0224 [Chlamydia abortus]|nr:uncharacterized protein CHAB577_0224 [Chlamydia abortus]
MRKATYDQKKSSKVASKDRIAFIVKNFLNILNRALYSEDKATIISILSFV